MVRRWSTKKACYLSSVAQETKTFTATSMASATTSSTVAKTTDSIVLGSTSIISVSSTPSGIDLNDFLSALMPTSIPTTTTTSSSTAFASTESASSFSSNVSKLPIASSTPVSNSDNSLSSVDLGAIIGGCSGGICVLVLIIFFLCIRKKNKKENEFIINNFARTSKTFYKDNNNEIVPVTTTQPFQTFQPNITKPPKAFDTPQQNGKGFYINNNDTTIKYYNILVGTDSPTKQNSPVTPPVNPYNNNVDQRRVQRSPSTVSKGARLSKYNYLTQAFSQMKPETNNEQASVSHQSVVMTEQNNRPHVHSPANVRLDIPSFADNNSVISEVSQYSALIQKQLKNNNSNNKSYPYI
ncbi:hypothetical protein CU098_012376 [Rhizopus stolonifer]|uniref:Mid2 domain-containing protein n=1 Tax=Rhizopus stolonifer TaxID=4846 RepID=A0A367KMX3_RHIST|nr:hypothetical protein CU098_012376 [Rhizopus stolonifer]